MSKLDNILKTFTKVTTDLDNLITSNIKTSAKKRSKINTLSFEIGTLDTESDRATKVLAKINDIIGD